MVGTGMSVLTSCLDLAGRPSHLYALTNQPRRRFALDLHFRKLEIRPPFRSDLMSPCRNWTLYDVTPLQNFNPLFGTTLEFAHWVNPQSNQSTKLSTDNYQALYLAAIRRLSSSQECESP